MLAAHWHCKIVGEDRTLPYLTPPKFYHNQEVLMFASEHKEPNYDISSAMSGTRHIAISEKLVIYSCHSKMAKKVLIIEDSDDIGNALKQLIEFDGYEAILANRAFIGRELATTIGPDLIIIDIRLPDEDGLQLTRQLRAAPETNTTPILCVSSYIDGLRTEALAAGCDEAFSKTSFMESFHETLHKYLAEPAARSASEQLDRPA